MPAKVPRPKESRETPATPSLSTFDFSKSLQKLTPDSFFRFIREYPEQEATVAYVYRLAPQIDRTQAGIKDSNIDVIGGEQLAQLDEEYLLRQHGSGRYHIKFTDGNKPKFLTEVAKTTIDVLDPRVPPLLNPVELVIGAKGNDRYVQEYVNKGWTVEDNRLKPPAAPESGSAMLAETVRDLALHGRGQGSEQLVDRLLNALEKRSNPGGDDEIDRALRIADRLKPAADPVSVQLMGVMVELLKDRRPAEPPRQAADPIGQLKEAAAFLKEMGWGQQAAPVGPSWVEILGQLPAIVQGLGALPTILAQLRDAQAPSKVVPITGEAVPAAPSNPAAPAAAGEGEDMFGKLGFGMKDLLAVGEDALDAFERGITGQDFAHSVVCRRNGEKLYDFLFEMGTEQLLAMLSMQPSLAEKLGPRRAEVEAWLNAFMAYGAAEDPGAAESSEPAA